MTGTTALLGLPYPDPTDPLAQGADAIKALAQSVEDRAAPTVIYAPGVALTGGGAFANIQALTIPAAPYARGVMFTSRFLVAFNGGAGWTVSLRDGTANLASTTYSAGDITAGRQATVILTAVYNLPAGVAKTFDVSSAGSANISGPAGAEYSLLTALIVGHLAATAATKPGPDDGEEDTE